MKPNEKAVAMNNKIQLTKQKEKDKHVKLRVSDSDPVEWHDVYTCVVPITVKASMLLDILELNKNLYISIDDYDATLNEQS